MSMSLRWARIEPGHYHTYAKPWGSTGSAVALDIIKRTNAINPAAAWHLHVGGNLRGMYYTLKAAKQAAETKI